MANIRQYLVPNSRAIVAKGTNARKYIALHETANTGRGANADSHARLQAGGNSRSASWHYQVDDKEIVQSYLDTTRCWHAGSSSYALDAISIEICVNSDGDYAKALQNAADLVAHLRQKHGIPWNRVISHNFITGKNCPTKLLASGDWDDFIAATEPGKGGNVTSTSPKPKPKPAGATQKNVRDEDSIRRICIRATEGTESNSTGHLIGLYQLAQLSPFELVHDQHWGDATDQHYRWTHKLQVEMNKWKGAKVNENGNYNAATHGRVKDLQERNHGGAYKGVVDGVAGPVFCKMLGIKNYPNK